MKYVDDIQYSQPRGLHYNPDSCTIASVPLIHVQIHDTTSHLNEIYDIQTQNGMAGPYWFYHSAFSSNVIYTEVIMILSDLNISLELSWGIENCLYVENLHFVIIPVYKCRHKYDIY